MARKRISYEIIPAAPEPEAEPVDRVKLDFYQQMRRKMRAWKGTRQGRSSRWSEYVLIAPDVFHLICRLALDPSVSLQHRLRMAAVAAYYVAPLDLMSEVLLGPMGFLDDLALAAFVLNGLLRDTPEEVIRRHWAGEGDILDWLERTIKSADDMLGGRVAGLLRKQVKTL
jgi:uncharacterized membrane protein YkvA (DUF1232 family)